MSGWATCQRVQASPFHLHGACNLCIAGVVDVRRSVRAAMQRPRVCPAADRQAASGRSKIALGRRTPKAIPSRYRPDPSVSSRFAQQNLHERRSFGLNAAHRVTVMRKTLLPQTYFITACESFSNGTHRVAVLKRLVRHERRKFRAELERSAIRSDACGAATWIRHSCRTVVRSSSPRWLVDRHSTSV
jgi:hypothetical protein